MNIEVEDYNEIDMELSQDEVELETGDTINIGTSDYEELTNKPSIEGTELTGDVSLDDIGAAAAEDIPTGVSELNNDAGYITSNDIPPLVTDLGNIDPSEYEDDREVFLNTLLQDGAYRFVFEDGDDYEYYVVVESMLDNGYVYQKYWSSEEGSNILYYCSLIVEDGEVVERSEENYMTLTEASNMFSIKTHAHFDGKNAAMSVLDWCDSNALTFDNTKPFIFYTDTFNNKNWLIERYTTVRQPNYRFIKVYDMSDASHFYIRSGSLSGNTTTWGPWKEYPSGGMNITVNGTNYPITAITKTLVSGVSGVLVDYDDGNSGQLFFADGVGLATVKSAIESGIPHDTSELTNGAGFLTISDLPIYDGGVQ